MVWAWLRHPPTCRPRLLLFASLQPPELLMPAASSSIINLHYIWWDLFADGVVRRNNEDPIFLQLLVL